MAFPAGVVRLMDGDHSAPAAPWEQLERVCSFLYPVLHPLPGLGPLLNGVLILPEVGKGMCKRALHPAVFSS